MLIVTQAGPFVANGPAVERDAPTAVDPAGRWLRTGASLPVGGLQNQFIHHGLLACVRAYGLPGLTLQVSVACPLAEMVSCHEEDRPVNELRKYYCDDLVISELLVSKKEESHHGKAAGIRLDMLG